MTSQVAPTSADPYVPGSRPMGSSSEVEAVFYAMATLVNGIESSNANSRAKAVAALDARAAEVADPVAARIEESKERDVDKKAPRSRISASLLLVGFMGGALLGYAFLSPGIADRLLGARQVQSVPPRAAEIVSPRAAEIVSPRPRMQLGHSPKFLVQIGSYKSQTEAMAAWSAFARNHPDAGAHKPDIKTVDLGGMGVWHRLRLSNFADKRAASVFCEQLKSAGAACLLGR